MASYYVYKHTFPNDKVYIGITSRKPEARWGRDGKGYRRKIKGKWIQPLMARATLKYKWDDIKHEVLFEGLTKEEAEAKEIELIAFYKSDDPEHGYNIEHGGRVNRVSEETKKKISQANKGKQKTENHKQKLKEANIGKHSAKPLICIETGVIYRTGTEASQATGISRPNILAACCGKQKTAGGFHWAYYTEQIAV